jgi:hypothetical protein
MSEYCSSQTSCSTSPVAFWDIASATPHKSSTLKQSSVFPSFSTHLGFDKKMDELFGCTNTSLSEGTVKMESERYVSGLASPHDMDILHFWEVSFPYAIRDEHSQSRWYRSIGANFWHYLQLLWTIYRFRHHLFLVNMYSCQPKRPTLWSVTEYTQCWWRHCKHWSFCSRKTGGLSVSLTDRKQWRQR